MEQKTGEGLIGHTDATGHDMTTGAPRLRRATTDDAATITAMIDAAKELLSHDGVDQWQDGYPDAAAIRDDIAHGRSYLMEADGAATATAAMLDVPDPNYGHLLEGKWTCPEEPYVTLHRVAVHPAWHGRGQGARLFDLMIGLARSRGFRQIRIDTHPDNRRMRRLISAFGFRYAGVAFMRGNVDDRRLAYQLFL